jgi:thioredoxin reductase (NADPH)
LGDVVEGLPELTSTAVKMGQHLGRRLAQRINNLKQFKHLEMFISLENYPTIVFTPLEYSLCGLSEEKAI